MKATFIETSEFTAWISEHLSDGEFETLQQCLMDDPDAGDVMPGCGGLRKIRTADPKRGKGKRSGARVIYLHVLAARRFYLLDVYGKDEKEDLTANEKKLLRQLVDQLKQEAIAAYQRSRQKNES